MQNSRNGNIWGIFGPHAGRADVRPAFVKGLSLFWEELPGQPQLMKMCNMEHSGTVEADSYLQKLRTNVGITSHRRFKIFSVSGIKLKIS